MILFLALATGLASLVVVGLMVALDRSVILDRLLGAGRQVAWFTIFSFLLLLGVQTLRIEALETFPFASWAMYGHAEPLTASWRLEAERASGAVEPLEPRLLSKEPNPRIVGFWIVRWGHELVMGDPAAVQAAEKGLEEFARSLAALDALRHPDDPITSVRLLHCALPLASGRVAAWRFECERARSWETGK